jgi:hypothetical protein
MELQKYLEDRNIKLFPDVGNRDNFNIFKVEE